MLEIERLSLRLPHFLSAHAAFIAEGVAAALAAAELGTTGTFAECVVPAIALDEGTTPALAVHRISTEVVRALARLAP